MKCLLLLSALFVSGNIFAKLPVNEFTMTVTEKGYEPDTLRVTPGKPVLIKITRKTNATCAREITVPSQKLKVDLPLDKEVTVKIAGLEKGEVKFGCAMDMMIGGVMLVQ